MPCIKTMVSVSISREKETALKTKFGKAISLLPGKSESWLMLTFEDNCRMYFKGTDNEASAFVEVKIFGGADDGAYDRLTKELTSILQQELSISPERIYIKYEEVAHWGWNGNNF